MEDLEIFDVAIVGGGPAGAYCAYQLAKKGIKLVVFDPSHPREKPCGGGLSPEVLVRYPFIHNLSGGRYSARVKMIAPSGKEAIAEGKRASFFVSRLQLDKCILDMAVDAGSKFLAERVVGLTKERALWVLTTTKRKIKSRIIVGADGVHSLVRKRILGPIPKENLGIGMGYFATGIETEGPIMKYLKNFGYIWIFPRRDHSSIGIGSELQYSRYLKKILDQFIRSFCPHIKKLMPFSAILPAIKDPNFYNFPCSGEDWILVGDAAGHVDPVVGEGILYAMQDGELASKAITSSDIKSFDELWWREYGYDLKAGCKLRNMFYDPFVEELTIKLASRSRSYSRLLYNIATSEQDYTTYLLKNIVELPRTLVESVLGFRVKL